MRLFLITEAQLKKYEGLFFLDDGAKDDFKLIRSCEVDNKCIVTKKSTKNSK